MIRINTKNVNLKKKDYEEYNINGYYLVENIISKATCQKLKRYAEKHYADKPKYPITLNIHRKDENFFNIISNKNILKIMKFFQKSKVNALNDQMIYKKKKHFILLNLGHFTKIMLILKLNMVNT